MNDYSQYGGANPMLAMMGPYFMVFAIVGLALLAFSIFIQWKIFSKAGYSGALALLNLLLIVPIINIIGCIVVFGLWVWFAFAKWPALGNSPPKT